MKTGMNSTQDNISTQCIINPRDLKIYNEIILNMIEYFEVISHTISNATTAQSKINEARSVVSKLHEVQKNPSSVKIVAEVKSHGS